MMVHLQLNFRRRTSALQFRDEIRRKLQLTRLTNGAVTVHRALLKKNEMFGGWNYCVSKLRAHEKRWRARRHAWGTPGPAAISGISDKRASLYIATSRTAESKGVVDAAARAVREALRSLKALEPSCSLAACRVPRAHGARERDSLLFRAEILATSVLSHLPPKCVLAWQHLLVRPD
jgi:hypothetical protein